MKLFVMADMEGISGIFQRSQTGRAEANFETGRRFLTWDVNACVAGCFEGGASEVIVRDAHGAGYGFVWEELDPRARYVQGVSERERIPGIAGCDGLILLGYHAMAGTREAVLEHTMSSAGWQNFWMNGRKCGEIAIDAGIAGDHGVPTVMVSGDDKTCREAKRFLPGVVTVEVKRGLAREGALLLSREEAHRRIQAGAAKAVGRCRALKPFRVKKPVTFRLEKVSKGRLPLHRPGVRVVDGRTYEVKAATVEEALNLL